jgi:methylated-DNA-[protein]-cysteine S-methyltransferase
VLLAINVEKILAINVFISEKSNLIEKIELTEEERNPTDSCFLNKQHKHIYQYFIEYFQNSDKKIDIYKYIDLNGYSEFSKSVYAETIKIPYGRTITYSDLAHNISAQNAVRAVGQCLSKNRYPLIIPCHRVVGKKNLGGFRYGLEMKGKIINREQLN